MTLTTAIAGATRPAQSIIFTDAAGTALVLTGATLTGTIKNSAGTVRDITGTLTVTTAASGIFSWEYSAADVLTSGNFTVQFTATFVAAPTVAKTPIMQWVVLASQTVT